MLRKTTIGALIGLVSVCSPPQARAQTYPYGVFRVNAAYLPESERKCWVQALVSGQTINAELLTVPGTVNEAQCALKQYERSNLCVRMGTKMIVETWSPSDTPATDSTSTPDEENIVESETSAESSNCPNANAG